MRILFIGDIFGRSGREALETYLPNLHKEIKPDVTIVNGENAAHGRGITKKIADQFFEMGVDCITTGNHVWDQREIIPYIESHPALLRPLNFPSGTPGNGSFVFTSPSGKKIKIINAMARLFMEDNDCPFYAIDNSIKNDRLGQNIDAIFVDFHGEATSEKMALGHHLDGRVTGVIGTHTHIPTADHHLLAGGTAYMSDAGMTGDYDSVIGAQKENPVRKFLKKVPNEKMVPASGEATLCGAVIEVNERTGLALSIEPIRRGGRLSQAKPAKAD